MKNTFVCKPNTNNNNNNYNNNQQPVNYSPNNDTKSSDPFQFNPFSTINKKEESIKSKEISSGETKIKNE